jgi:hypothetical protein
MTVLAGRSAATIAILLIAFLAPALAQERVSLRADVLFYGDNTEFRNPFREGETIFGTAVRLGASIEVTPRVSLLVGGFGNTRFGSEDAFETVRPVVALLVRSGKSRFQFGTLPPPHVVDPPGPDRCGPHGLIPPIQRETLAFERAHEAGLLWSFAAARVRHEAWLNWQRLNTPSHRERFDAGVNAEARLNDRFAIPLQVHVVHEGGQLHASGPVADSVAMAAGLALRMPAGRFDTVSLEVLGVASRHVPDRAVQATSRFGGGFFARGVLERGGWRGHAIVWRGDDFVKSEGDPNYHSVRRDGSRFRNIRDYAEAGLTRVSRPAPGVALECSARLHRIEHYYEYSYRVVATVSLRAPIR